MDNGDSHPFLFSEKPHTQRQQNGDQPLVKNLLSKSLQAYFEKMTGAVLGPDPEMRNEALKHIAIDTGISELTPYFVQMASERVTSGMGNLDVLERMVAMLEALLDNPEVDISLYIHQMMPTILTVLVAKRLSAPGQDHWSLRRRAAKLVARIFREHGAKYPSIQPRTTRTLLKAFLDPLKPRVTHYGAVVGLGELGRETVRMLVLPNIQVFGAVLEQELPDPSNPGSEEKAKDAKHLFDAVVVGYVSTVPSWTFLIVSRFRLLVRVVERHQRRFGDAASTSGSSGAPAGKVRGLFLRGDLPRNQSKGRCRWRGRCGHANK